MTFWDVVGNLSLSLLIGSETLAAVGVVVWALFYYTGLLKMAVYGALGMGGVAGVISAVWIYRLALKQKRVQARDLSESAVLSQE